MRSLPSKEDSIFFESERVHIIIQNLENLDLGALPSDIDTLMSLAQSSHFREFPQKAEEVFSVNVTANLRLFQWAASSGVKQVVHASSGGIYGGKSGGEFFENDLFAIDSPLGFYLGSKLCSEIVFQNYAHFFESAVTLRPFFIYGPGQRKDMFIARLIESVRAAKAISLQGRDGLRANPIYVDDAVSAFRNALALSGTHVINVAGPETTSLREIGELIAKTLGLNVLFEHRQGEPVDYVGDIKLMVNKLGPPRFTLSTGIALTVKKQTV